MEIGSKKTRAEERERQRAKVENRSTEKKRSPGLILQVKQVEDGESEGEKVKQRQKPIEKLAVRKLTQSLTAELENKCGTEESFV